MTTNTPMNSRYTRECSTDVRHLSEKSDPNARGVGLLGVWGAAPGWSLLNMGLDPTPASPARLAAPGGDGTATVGSPHRFQRARAGLRICVAVRIFVDRLSPLAFRCNRVTVTHHDDQPATPHPPVRSDRSRWDHPPRPDARCPAVLRRPADQHGGVHPADTRTVAAAVAHDLLDGTSQPDYGTAPPRSPTGGTRGGTTPPRSRTPSPLRPTSSTFCELSAGSDIEPVPRERHASGPDDQLVDTGTLGREGNRCATTASVDAS
jgi:hypothetical protein